MFALSERLGGRTEVLKTPVVESLGYVLMTREENKSKARNEESNEEMKIWINYLSLIHSRPLPEKATHEQKKSRQDFIEMIKPKEKEESKLPKKVFQWDYEKEAMQEGG